MSDKKNCILVLIEGIVGRPFHEIGLKTPLAAAKTPNLDKIALMGSNGRYYPLTMGTALPPEISLFFLAGCKAEEFPGMGYITAVSAGLVKEEDSVYFIATPCPINKTGNFLTCRQRDVSDDLADLKELIASVSPYEDVHGRIILHLTEEGCILEAKGILSRFVSDSDPMVNGQNIVLVEPWEEFEDDKSALRCARIINDYLIYVHETLLVHPVNIKRVVQGKLPINGIVTRLAGKAVGIRPFETRWGLNAKGIMSNKTCEAIFKIMSIETENLPEGDDVQADIARKIKAALTASESNDFVLVHSDILSKRKLDPNTKVAMIESIDRGLAELVDGLDVKGNRLVIIAGSYANSIVPLSLSIAGCGMWPDDVSVYDEMKVSKGMLGSLKERDLIHIIVSALGKKKPFGFRDTSLDLNYYPGPRTPLDLSKF